MTNPHVSVAPSSPTNDGQAWLGAVTTLPIAAGDPIWVRQYGAETETECYVASGYIAQVGDQVWVNKIGRVGYVVGRFVPQPGWNAMSPLYGTNITDFGTPYDIGAYIKLGSTVHLRGLIKTTAAIAQGATIFTMPSGYGMAPFDANGSVTFGGLFSSGTLQLMRFQIIGYAFVTATGLASGSNLGLTGISYPADI